MYFPLPIIDVFASRGFLLALMCRTIFFFHDPLQSLFRRRSRRIMRPEAKPSTSSAEGAAGNVEKKLGE
jgi:hypothetical protein